MSFQERELLIFGLCDCVSLLLSKMGLPYKYSVRNQNRLSKTHFEFGCPYGYSVGDS